MSSLDMAMYIEPSLFSPDAISEESQAFNEKLMEIGAKGPKWYEVGAEKYRQMRAAGETPLPAATLLESATTFSIPSRDSGRQLPCRILKPQDGKPVRAVFMHIHGGGWVLQDEKSQDPLLQYIADQTGLLAISIGYRLAPENPYPAATNDCYDAVEWLVDNAESTFGAPLRFIGGESAGGHLSMCTAMHLLHHPNSKYADHQLRGLLLHFGVYDVTFTPQVYNFKKPATLVLDHDIMIKYREAFLPGVPLEESKNPAISPLYTDLGKLRGKLPPALFTAGTQDCLLDDSIFMSAKWMMAGGEAVVKIIPGAVHGYILFPRGTKGSGCDEGQDAVVEYVNAKLKL